MKLGRRGFFILCFTVHTTHLLQMAEFTYTRLLSKYYDHQMTVWFRSNARMVVTVRQVAFIQSSSLSTSVNVFKKYGIWPFEPIICSESDLAPSLMTDAPQIERLPHTPALEESSCVFANPSAK